MKELWSPGDTTCLESFKSAVRERDLVRALASIEGLNESARGSDCALLASWAADVKRELAANPHRSAVDEARALEAALGRRAGLRGDDADYYGSQNSLLHSVLERRRGMPILLSIIWMEVGRLAGLSVYGIGMPGHFLARVGEAGGVLVDPFSGGVMVTVEDCRRTVKDLSGGAFTWSDEFLSASSADQILERVLQNLAGSYAREQDEAGRYRVATFLSALRPDSAERILERAEIAGSIGLRDIAVEGYSELLQRFPGTEAAQQAEARLDEKEIPGLTN